MSDESGEIAKELCKKAGHVFSHEIIDDSKPIIRLKVLKALFEDGSDAAILMGGTGLAPRDVTIFDNSVYKLPFWFVKRDCPFQIVRYADLETGKACSLTVL